MPPAYVKAYVSRQERRGRCRGDLRGGARPTMRFVPVKSVEQQAALALHRTRELLVGSGPS